MSCNGPAISLPNITCIDFKLDWDISTGSPIVKVTNNSTVVNASKLKWWFYITSPSGEPIYGVNVNVGTPPPPDVNLVSFTTKTFVLPTPFGNAPCGQIEFSPNSPYIVTVYVQDIDAISSPIDSYSKRTLIVRPNGNTVNSCGNFGRAAINIKVDCGSKEIMCMDGTKTIYNNIIAPISTTQKWTLVYPADDSGDIPNIVAENVPNVNFPVSVNSKGYSIYFNETATYDYGDNVTVKVQYKLYDSQGLGLSFAVNCNTNLCLLQCQMKKYYELSKAQCGDAVNPALTAKMVNLQWLFSQILSGIFQPLCSIDIGGLIDEMKRIMGLGDDCDCGCGENDNFGFSNPMGSGSGGTSSSCCPETVLVNNINTNLPPATCPDSYFPAAIYTPDGSSVIGVATNADGMVSIINSNASWGVYGTAFNMGNCQVGFYKNPGINSVPEVLVSVGTTITVIDNTTGIPPAACPGTYFPVTVYAPDGTTVLGVASSAATLIALVNANASWNLYGIAYYNGTNCTVSFIPADGVDPAVIPPIIVAGTDACVGGIQHYTASVQDICGINTPPITISSFPLNAWVDFGLGLVSLGSIANNAAFITALNAATGKPISVTFSAGPYANLLNYDVDNTDCSGYSGLISIYTDANSGAAMLYAANHKTIATPQVDVSGIYGVGVKTNAIIGEIPGLVSDEYPWHVTKVQGNYLFTAFANSGVVYCWDITNPLVPALIGTVTLPDTGGGDCFTGIPQQFGVNMYYSLYFPTDYHNMNLNEVYICEALTGSIWAIDFSIIPTVVKSFQDDQLIAKCPRVIYKGDLYYTQDGNLETVTASSGIGIGEIVRFKVSNDVWDASAINVDEIIPNEVEEVWAASWDGSGLIYFVGQAGTIATYNPITNLVVNRYDNVMGQTANLRLNSKYYIGKLYLSTYGGWSAPGGLLTGTRFIETSTLGTTNDITNFQAFSADNNTHWNFAPIGNCNGVLTYEDAARGAGFAIFKLDGSFVSNITYSDGASYNVVVVPGIGVYSPSSLV